VGCEPDYFAIKDWTVASGVLFDSTQEHTAARVAVLGHTFAADLFGASSPVGQRMMINRVPFTVIGVLRERGQGLDVSNEDNQVYVPLRAAMRRLMNADYYSGILVEIDSLSSMDEAAERIRFCLGQSHRMQLDQRQDFQVQNQKTLFDTQMAASERLGFFLRWVGASALLVSGLGIAAITWVAVRERTREIGTRRALGATSADIFLQIQFENGVLALSGGLLGVGLAWPVSHLLSSRVGLPFVFEAKNAFLVFEIAATLNLVFSLLSSRKAASVAPIEALRYE
jgi:putative ABC transport system permease protein